SCVGSGGFREGSPRFSQGSRPASFPPPEGGSRSGDCYFQLAGYVGSYSRRVFLLGGSTRNAPGGYLYRLRRESRSDGNGYGLHPRGRRDASGPSYRYREGKTLSPRYRNRATRALHS